jgi:hypothetical protein
MGLWPWIHGWFRLAFHPGASASDISPRATCWALLLLVVYQCMVVNALRHDFSFSCLLFSLLFLFLTNDTTPLPAPHDPSVLHPQNPCLSPSFSKNNLPFSLQMKLPPWFHHCDHKASTYNGTLWQPLMYEKHLFEPPWKMMKTYLHELNEIIKKSFFSFFLNFLLFYLWSHMEKLGS